MARLDDLSTELILDILDRIPPEDLESTTLISKRIYLIAYSLLVQHRKVLEEQYRTWDNIVEAPEDPLYHDGHMCAGLLCTIFTDRRLAKMVETLGIWSTYKLDSDIDLEKAWSPDELFPGSLPGLRQSQRLAKGALRTSIQILEQAVCQCTLVTQSQRETWLKKLYGGSEELAAVLLLWHLPALESITLDLGSGEWTDIYAFLLQLVEHAVTASARPTLAHVSTGLPMQYLDHVFITFDKPRFENGALIKAFLSLPRLSAFGCQNLSLGAVRKATPIWRLAKSSAMESLTFNRCILDMEGLSGLLESVTAVRHFAYTWDQTTDLDTYDWVKFGPPAVIGALVGSISHSLEILELLAWDRLEVQHIDPSMHFRDFRALRQLEITTNILLAQDGSNVSSFALMLPARLEQLDLHWIKLAPVPDILTFSELLKNFADQAKVQLTSLRGLTLIGDLDDNEMEGLADNNGKEDFRDDDRIENLHGDNRMEDFHDDDSMKDLLAEEEVRTRCHRIGHLTLSVYSHEGFR